MLGARWFRYPWEGIRNWKYFWVADPQYVDAVNGLWIPQKGGFAWSVPSGATFPSYSPNAWGTTGRGRFRLNGTTDMFFLTGAPAAVMSNFQSASVLVAGSLNGTVASNERFMSFANTSDTTDAIGIQTIGNQGALTHPLGLVMLPHSGTVTSQTYYQTSTTNGGTFVATFALLRNVGTSKYVVSSSTYGGSSSPMVPLGATDFTTNTITLSKVALGGYFGASKFFSACDIRAIGISPIEMTVSGSTPTGEQQAPANYLEALRL